VLKAKTKIFDPLDEATGTGGAELLDATVVRLDSQWWMFLGGQAAGFGPTDIYSASLPPGSALSATGWTITRDAGGAVEALAARNRSGAWDGNGGGIVRPM
jgi:hypothetical protein